MLSSYEIRLNDEYSDIIKDIDLGYEILMMQ